MAIYEFIACNEKLTSFEEALSDEEIKSYNELLNLGLSEDQLRIRGIDVSKIDRNKKVFLIKLPEELQNSPLKIEEDFHHPYARFLTDKKFIYRITGVDKVIPHFAGYIGKYAKVWKELELWRVSEDDYSIDSTDIPRTIEHLDNITLDELEAFYIGPVPKRLILVQN